MFSRINQNEIFQIVNIFIVFFLCEGIIFAQNTKKLPLSGEVMGVVTDARTLLPLQSVNFVLKSVKDSTKVFGAASNSDGYFIVKDIPLGVYNAKISCIGYKSRTRNNMIFNSQKNIVNLDTIKLLPRSLYIQEVNISGTKERVFTEKDKFIVRSDRELGNNAFEQLENMPMVNVDIDNSIKLMGQNAKIYIDGMPAKFYGIENNEDLKMLNSIEIEKFELIIDAASEFDEAKNGRVINIITKKTKETKFAGNIGSAANTRNQYSGNTGGLYNEGKFSVKAIYNLNYSKNEKTNSSFKTLIYNGQLNSIDGMENNNNELTKNSYRVNVNFTQNKNIRLSYGLNFTSSDNKNNNTLENKITTADNSRFSIAKSDNSSDLQQGFFTNSLMYSQSFDEPGRTLNISISYNRNRMSMDGRINKSDASVLSDDYSPLKTNTKTLNTNNNMLSKVNYNHPIDSVFRLLFSGRLAYSKLGMENNYYLLNSALNDFEEDYNLKSKEEQSLTTSSISGSFEGKIAGIGFSANLSCDNKTSRNDNNAKNYSYSNNFFNLTPGMRLRYKLFGGVAISGGFGRMIFYPLNRELSPYINITDSSNITVGNPGLQPGKVDNYSISVTHSIDNIYINYYAGFYKSDNLIAPVTKVLNSLSTVTTYQNAAKMKNYSFSASASFPLFPWLNADSNFGLSYNDYNVNDVENKGTSWNSSLKLAGKLSNFLFQMSFSYSSPYYNPQEKAGSLFYANAALKALFLDRRLSITFTTQDLFNTMKRKYSSHGSGFNFTNNENETTRIFSLNVSYYFNLKADERFEEKQTNEEIRDDF